MRKKLTIENFEEIKDKETENLKITDAAAVGNSKYVFVFQLKDNPVSNGEVTINRYDSSTMPNAFFLEICWKSRNNRIYSEVVKYDVFKQKTEFFKKLDEIIVERLK
jgi:hypothetical protein